MAFTDKITQQDEITIALNCGLCGQPARPDHNCTTRKRMLRNPAVVWVTCLNDEGNPLDDFLVQNESAGEEYVTSRRNIERDYVEI